jgi:hypothetical protein
VRKLGLGGETASKLGLEPGEYEMHEIREGVVVLSFVGPPRKDEPAFGAEQLSVLRKLSSFRFEKRIPYAVNKSLTEAERKTLEGLIRQGLVELYREGKYSRTGVYNIPKSVYPLLREQGKEPRQNARPGGMEMLQKFGYAIVENEGEARDISGALEKQIRAGEYRGTRAFNKKFYIASKGFYVSLGEQIRRLLARKDATAHQIAQELKVQDDACAVVLQLMNDDSEVIEKKKGFYGLV